jgi:ubiquitin-conjugating enzyme E2 J2
MIETGATLGSVETSTSQKLKFARQSLDFNVRDPTFCKLFPEYLELHEERMALRREDATNNPGNVSAPVSHESSTDVGVHAEHGVNGLFATAAGVIAILSIVFAMRFI